MNLRKQTLTLLCVLCGLSQTPPANAQAEILVGMAAKLLPVVIPMALCAIPAVPTLIGQYAHMPHLPACFSKGKKQAAADESTEKIATKTSESETEAESSDNEKSKAESRSEDEQSSSSRRAHSNAQETVTSARHIKPDDNSEWYLDDDNEQSKASTLTAKRKPLNSNQKIADRSEEMHSTKAVKGTVINLPATATPGSVEGEKASAKSIQPEKPIQSKEEKNGSAPIIMMNVSD